MIKTRIEMVVVKEEKATDVCVCDSCFKEKDIPPEAKVLEGTRYAARPTGWVLMFAQVEYVNKARQLHVCDTCTDAYTINEIIGRVRDNERADRSTEGKHKKEDEPAPKP